MRWDGVRGIELPQADECRVFYLIHQLIATIRSVISGGFSPPAHSTAAQRPQ
jgi:hypothetical protein